MPRAAVRIATDEGAAMALLHDAAVRSSIEHRFRALRADASPKWGKMSVDQMLWHVNEAMAVPLGQRDLTAVRVPLPASVIKFLVLNLPWTKGAPTNPALVAKGRHDFEIERARCLQLIDALASRPLDRSWPRHAMFGTMTGRDVSRLHAKHLDHHLRQFGS